MIFDDDTRRRWHAASDEFLDRAVREREKSLQDIASEVIKRYQGPAKAAEIVDHKYRKDNSPKTKNVDMKKLMADFLKAKEAGNQNELKRLRKLIDEIRASPEVGN